MKRILLILTLIAPALAQTAAPTEQQVYDLFKVMHIKEQTLAVLDSSKDQVKQTNRHLIEQRVPNITPVQLAEVDGMIDELYNNYPVDRILTSMVPVYQKHLTAADLEAVATFYGSPVGQKLLREMPAMTAEAMQISSSFIQKDTEDIMQKLDQHIQELARQSRVRKKQ